MQARPIRYYDNIELVEFRYGDMLLPSEVYEYLQQNIKSATTLIMPANFFEYHGESVDGKYYIMEAKEYIKLYNWPGNEKGIRLFIEPFMNDRDLVPIVRFPRGVDEYMDKDPNLYQDTGWLVVDYDAKNNWWTVRKKIYMDLDSIPNVAKYKGEGRTFFFGVLMYFPDVRYKIAFSDNEINKALSALPKEVCETMHKSEISWSWLLNYLVDVRVVYLIGKGHDVSPYYSVTDWLKYFVAGIVR
jgi:hypothetical protein